MSWLDGVKDTISGFREETYPKVRNYLARNADLLGGAASDADAKKVLHGQGNYNLTKKLGSVLPPDLAASVADALYLGNETLTGTLSKATGRPFFSDYGFRWKDVGINRGGQDRAVQDLVWENTNRRAKTDREPYNVR
jgi:hypothetical protein